MSKVQKSPARSPRTNFLKLDEKSQHYDFGDDDEEVKRENGNSDMDIESAISVSTEINSPKKDSNGEDADVKMQSPVKVEQHVKPETSKRKLEGDEEEEEEFFGFELSPLKDFNKVKKLKEHTPKTPVSANQGNSVHQQVVVPQKAVPNRPIPLSDPIYQEPFKFGWKRELVINEQTLIFCWSKLNTVLVFRCFEVQISVVRLTSWARCTTFRLVESGCVQRTKLQTI
jgi:hypothetical protein